MSSGLGNPPPAKDALSRLREADFSCVSRWGRQQPAQRVEHFAKVVIVIRYPPFDDVKTLRYLSVAARVRAQADERADHENAHLDSTWAVQNGRSHKGAVLCVHPGQLPSATVP